MGEVQKITKLKSKLRKSELTIVYFGKTFYSPESIKTAEKPNVNNAENDLLV